MAQSSINAGNAKQPRTKSYVQSYLTNCRSFYSCIHCRAHLANHDDLVSRSFQGNHSRAYLFNSLMNVTCGQAVNRELNTGTHAVADIFCSNCNTLIGWKYEKAFVESQKYKEGKYIIELSHVLRENKHLELERGEKILNRTRGSNSSSSKRVCNSRGSSFSQNTNHVNKRLLIHNKRNSLSDSSPTSSPEIATSPSTSHELSGSHGITDTNEVTSNNLETKFQQLSTNDIDNNNYNSSEDDDHDDDDGDELIFPFYDDLCADLLIYPGGLSSNHKRLTQKYIYTLSEPYDWKHPSSVSSSVTKSLNSDIKETSLDIQTNMASKKEVDTDNILDEDEHRASSQVDSEIRSNNNSEVTISSSTLNNNDKNDNRIDGEIFISTENIANNHRLSWEDAGSAQSTSSGHLINNDEDEFFDCFQ